jgi:hypothetical protein
VNEVDFGWGIFSGGGVRMVEGTMVRRPEAGSVAEGSKDRQYEERLFH